MNLQRREEIREMMHKPAGNMHEMYHDIIDMQQALSDMLAHIDTLEQTAAERVIADGKAPAVVVPALTDEDLNRYSMDCDERDAVEFGYNLAASRIIPAGRVTIPPLTGGEIEARLLRLFPGISEDDPLREACFKDSRWAYNLAVSRARPIPADRVLGEGMLQVDPGLLLLLDKALEQCRYSPQHYLRSAIQDIIRANQGGAAT